MENNPKMAMTPKGLRYLLIGLIVMVFIKIECNLIPVLFLMISRSLSCAS